MYKNIKWYHFRSYWKMLMRVVRNKEYILCSANWYKELPLVDEEVLRIRGFSPYNVDRGIVFCGWRHPNALYQMVAITGKSQCEAGDEVQGFLTSKNRFVDRKDAAKIAYSVGQYPKLLKRLHSEDVW